MQLARSPGALQSGCPSSLALHQRAQALAASPSVRPRTPSRITLAALAAVRSRSFHTPASVLLTPASPPPSSPLFARYQSMGAAATAHAVRAPTPSASWPSMWPAIPHAARAPTPSASWLFMWPTLMKRVTAASSSCTCAQ